MLSGHVRAVAREWRCHGMARGKRGSRRRSKLPAHRCLRAWGALRKSPRISYPLRQHLLAALEVEYRGKHEQGNEARTSTAMPIQQGTGVPRSSGDASMLVGPYSRPKPRAVRWPLPCRGAAPPSERGTPVLAQKKPPPP